LDKHEGTQPDGQGAFEVVSGIEIGGDIDNELCGKR